MAAVTTIGLDIGSTAIRAVETSHGKDGPSILNYGYAALPPEAVRSGVIHDEDAVIAGLRQLWGAIKFTTKDVVLGVTNPHVVVREMSVANLPNKELRKSLPFQVRDALPLPVERSLLDFYPLEDPGQNETVRGLLIAAPKEAVIAAVSAIEKAGLRVRRVDLASFALLRAASRLDGQVEAIVDIGAQISSVIVHADGEPLIVRTIPRGGSDITALVASRLDIPPVEAEALKCQVGLQTSEDAKTAMVVREAVRPLLNEIRSSFAYLTAGERPVRVTRLALSGGGSMLPGLIEELAAELGVEVVIADPVIRLHDQDHGRHDNREHFRSSAGVSIGLTLGAA